MLPAGRGDALLIEYGPGNKPEHRVLIDGGPVNSGLYDGIRDRLEDIPRAENGHRHVELLIVTHIDTDHVEGVIRLLQDDDLALAFGDIWFNGWKHISTLTAESRAQVLGGVQGEFLGALLDAQGRPWNQYFSGGPILITDNDPLPVIRLRGGLVLTLLSPTLPKLETLADDWEDAVKDAGFTPGDAATVLKTLGEKWWAKPHVLGDADDVRRSRDSSSANGSSIAVLAEHSGRCLLLVGDAHDDVLTRSLRRVRSDRSLTEPLPLDAFKVSHHGSSNNLTELLLREIAVDSYLISTNGKRFSHPDDLAIRQLINRHQGSGPPKFHFNYDQTQTQDWRNESGIETFYGLGAVLTYPGDSP